MPDTESKRPLREEAFSIPVDTGRVFAFLHEPVAPAATAVVMVHACAEEKNWAHRVYVSFARNLARRGIAALRIDCRGEGESDLEFEDSTLETRVADAVGAVRFLRAQRPDLRNIVLLGHRLGAMVAALAAVELGGELGALVLWDPVYDGRTYLLQVLRQHLAAQMAASGRVSVPREELLRKMTVGELIVIEGYGFGGKFCKEVLAASWVDNAAVFRNPTLITEIASSEVPRLSQQAESIVGAHSVVTAISVKEPAFWRENRDYIQWAPALTASTVQWLESL